MFREQRRRRLFDRFSIRGLLLALLALFRAAFLSSRMGWKDKNQ
jgi:hypothetical protein